MITRTRLFTCLSGSRLCLVSYNQFFSYLMCSILERLCVTVKGRTTWWVGCTRRNYITLIFYSIPSLSFEITFWSFVWANCGCQSEESKVRGGVTGQFPGVFISNNFHSNYSNFFFFTHHRQSGCSDSEGSEVRLERKVCTFTLSTLVQLEATPCGAPVKHQL